MPEENDPRLTINNDGEMLEFTRRNTALFTYLGEWATHNHIFLICEDIPDEDLDPDQEYETAYIWEDNEMFDPLFKFMVANQFMMHMNLPKPGAVDREAYERAHPSLEDLHGTDFIPEDWT